MRSTWSSTRSSKDALLNGKLLLHGGG